MAGALALFAAGLLLVLSALPAGPVGERMEADPAASVARWEAWGRQVTHPERGTTASPQRYQALAENYYWTAYRLGVAAGSARWSALGS